MIYISILISIIYLALIMAFIIGFEKVETVKNNDTVPKNRFSIVIPFRNEAHNLPGLLKSISIINYPSDLFEILLVNDDSQDYFNLIIEEFTNRNPSLNFQLLKNIRKTNSPKKDAINSAINLSNFEWIVTTDADCVVPVNWLKLFNQFIENENPVFISAPVKFSIQNSLLFQYFSDGKNAQNLSEKSKIIKIGGSNCGNQCRKYLEIIYKSANTLGIQIGFL